MLEIITFLIKTLFKSFSISSIVENRKNKQINEIGAELFVLYTSLNEIYILGQSIVHELEVATSWLASQKQQGKNDKMYHTALRIMLRQQAVNINVFILSIKRLALELQVIAPDAYSKVIPLMRGKMNSIQILINILNGGDIVYLDVDTSTQLLSSEDGLTNLRLHFQRVLLTKNSHELEVDNLSRLKQSSYETIRQYLDTTDSEERLQEIKITLEDIRQGIVDNFSLQEILLEVGDRRGTASDLFIGFR